MGVKSFATKQALIEGSADYVGQLCVTADGQCWSIARGTAPGETALPLVNLNEKHYFQETTADGKTRLNKMTFANGLQVVAEGDDYLDNTICVLNQTGGFSSISFFRPADESINPAYGASYTIGYGPGTTPGAGNQYVDRVYVAVAPKEGFVGTGVMPEIVHTQEGNGNLHVRHMWESASLDLVWYGFTIGQDFGVEALRIKRNGCLNIPNAPKSSLGLAPGDVWDNDGVLNIVH